MSRVGLGFSELIKKRNTTKKYRKKKQQPERWQGQKKEKTKSETPFVKKYWQRNITANVYIILQAVNAIY